jgi:hypothetical protein
MDPRDNRLDVLDMMTNPGVPPRRFRGTDPVQSRMLPKLSLCAADLYVPNDDEV